MKVMILRLERDGIAAQAEVSAILAEAGAGAPDPNYGCSEAPPDGGNVAGPGPQRWYSPSTSRRAASAFLFSAPVIRNRATASPRSTTTSSTCVTRRRWRCPAWAPATMNMITLPVIHANHSLNYSTRTAC